MKRLTNLKKILIIDFGSQFTQLIARRIRELGVFSEIVSHKNLKKINVNDLFGIILSGGPLNVYQDKKIKFSNKIFYLECPILGICFGYQTLSMAYGGNVTSMGKMVDTRKKVHLKKSKIFKGMNRIEQHKLVYKSLKATIKVLINLNI